MSGTKGTKDSATCKGCGAPILWATNVKTGRRIPLDVRARTMFVPTDGANLKEVEPLVLDRGGAVVPLRSSHFDTCPQADQFRRPRGGAGRGGRGGASEARHVEQRGVDERTQQETEGRRRMGRDG